MKDVLVVIFLRGGCDILSLLPPVSGRDREIYEAERPNLKIATSSLLPLDGRFGFHPLATALHKLYESKKLAIITAAGINSDNRSHFEAQKFIELGTPENKGTRNGWLTRHLQGKIENPLQTVTIGTLTPTSLLGCANTSAVALPPMNFATLGSDNLLDKDMRDTLRRLYQGSSLIMEKGRSALNAVQTFNDGDLADYRPKVQYPDNDMGTRLRMLAHLIKMNLGIQAATVTSRGWDTHSLQGQGSHGKFAKSVAELSGALGAFYSDMDAKNLTIVLMSEFGRRVRENVSLGTDHGHGGVMMVLGDTVKGGRVYGEWPGLESAQLFQRADVAVTTDYRQVLSEVLRGRRGEKNLANVFPGFMFKKELGLFA